MIPLGKYFPHKQIYGPWMKYSLVTGIWTLLRHVCLLGAKVGVSANAIVNLHIHSHPSQSLPSNLG